MPTSWRHGSEYMKEGKWREIWVAYRQVRMASKSQFILKDLQARHWSENGSFRLHGFLEHWGNQSLLTLPL
jgi:hypothetical protein